MIIGFIGLMQSGKTTASQYLQEKYDFEAINFKDGLKEEMIQNFPRTMREMVRLLETIDYDGMDPWSGSNLFKKKPAIFRAFMQEYGTEVRRGDNEYYWTGKWARKAMECEKNVVVDDVRFLNEAEVIKNAGGKLVKIERQDITDTGNHPSETEMSKIVPDYFMSIEKGDFRGMERVIDTYVEQLQNKEKVEFEKI